MWSFVKFFLRRLVYIFITLVVVTIALYGVFMLTPVEARAMLYLPRGGQGSDTLYIQEVIDEHGLNDPFLVQYAHWVSNMLRGDWGWSPSMRADVLEALIRRTPMTAELALYSILLFFPLGLASGTLAGWKRGRPSDFNFRLAAFVATSIPPFILGLILISIFYVGLKLFPVGRLSISSNLLVKSDAFTNYTGLLTVDGLLNGRVDITLEALRHLVLPVITLSLAHWATLGRVTRAAIIEELSQDYIMAARGRGLSIRQTVWYHALRNALLPAFNSTALSAATLITGLFVVEIIFNLPGVSEPLASASSYSLSFTPDIAATMGFAVYSMVLVLIFMLVLDILQALADPRVREGVLS